MYPPGLPLLVLAIGVSSVPVRQRTQVKLVGEWRRTGVRKRASERMNESEIEDFGSREGSPCRLCGPPFIVCRQGCYPHGFRGVGGSGDKHLAIIDGRGVGRGPSHHAFVTHVPRGKVVLGQRHQRSVSRWTTIDPKRNTAQWSVAEKRGREGISDIDARVLNELLEDPDFMKSMKDREISIEDITPDPEEAGKPTNSGDGSVAKEKEGLAILSGGSKVGYGTMSTMYESVTMQAVEGLQNSVRGFVAKMTATIESAGIYIANRAKMDTKILAEVASYTSQRVTADARQMLMAATVAASPALQLMGVNATEAQNSMNTTIQLMSLGIFPESMGSTPQLLGSLKDFDDEDKRLAAAYKQQRRRRSSPLPAKLLGALPSTLNKAADLGYEVEQEVKYEQAGNRVNKLLKPLGISLVEDTDKSPLLRGDSVASSPKLESASTREVLAGRRQGGIASAKTIEVEVGRGPGSGIEKELVNSVSMESRANYTDGKTEHKQQREKPRLGNVLSEALGMFSGMGSSAGMVAEEDIESTSGVGQEEHLAVDAADMAWGLSARPGALAQELTSSLWAVEEEQRMQAESVSAAAEVVLAIKPLLEELRANCTREEIVVDQLKAMPEVVTESTTLAELNQAVTDVVEQLLGLETTIANLVALEEAMVSYSKFGRDRSNRLIYLRSKLTEIKALMNEDSSTGEVRERLAARSLNLVGALDAERAARRPAVESVGGLVSDVLHKLRSRPREGGLAPHETFFISVAGLWITCTPVNVEERESLLWQIEQDLRDRRKTEAVATVGVSAASVGEALRAPPANAGVGASLVDGVEREASGALGASPGEMITSTAKVEEVEEAPQVASSASIVEEKAAAGGMETPTPIAAKVGMAITEVAVAAQEEVGGTEVPSFGARGIEQSLSKALNGTQERESVPDTTSVSRATVSQKRATDKGLKQAGLVHEVGTSIEGGVSGVYLDDALGSRGNSPAVVDTAIVDVTISGSDVQREESGTDKSVDALIVQVVTDEDEGVVDATATVEDEDEQNKVALKVLDVLALLVEKVLFTGVPALVLGGALAWERVDNAVNGARGRKGWRLLKCIKRDGFVEKTSSQGDSEP
ncbi:unnamed protein product [Discosporangium mesarthrocarpum]